MASRKPKKPVKEIEFLQGTLVSQRYRAPGFAIASLLVKGTGREVTVVGNFPSTERDELINITGYWVEHVTYGKQFQVTMASRVVPNTSEGIARYLAGEIPGVGPKRAAALVSKFGTSLKSVLDKTPERLTEVPGFSKKTVERISKAWKVEHIQQELTIFLAQYGISKHWAGPILETLGGKAVENIKANPYKLTAVHGIGFKSADDMAKKMKWPENSPERLEALFTYMLEEASYAGHTHLPEDLLVQQVLKEIDVLPAEAVAALGRVLTRKDLVREEIKSPAGMVNLIYLPNLCYHEKELALRLKALINAPGPNKQYHASNFEDIEKELDIKLSGEQWQAILHTLFSKLSILTGGPGTGKTTTLKVLTKVASKLGLKIELAAPTGRAAKRMTEVSGKPAKTIHRLLEFQPKEGTFDKNKDNKLNCDILAIDETSMVDIGLARHLLDAVDPNKTSVIFIGDSDQLPSVGPGNVLKDMLSSGKIKSTKLTKIFRQAEDSLIVRNAYRIIKGETPNFPPAGSGDHGDSHMVEIKGYKPEELVKAVVDTCVNTIPNKFNLDPCKDIQVMVPMKRGPCGSWVINRELQKALNPYGEPIDLPNNSSDGLVFRVGDKVMQIVNNYETDTYNGDIGVIKSADPEDKIMVVNFYDREVEYPYEDAYELSLAYASTVHKSQGSEYKACIIVATKGHYIMLNRNLLYTANTRAKQLVIYVGDKSALSIAVRKADTGQRNSLLEWRLKN